MERYNKKPVIIPLCPLEEVAEYLKIEVLTILRLASEDDILAVKVVAGCDDFEAKRSKRHSGQDFKGEEITAV